MYILNVIKTIFNQRGSRDRSTPLDFPDNITMPEQKILYAINADGSLPLESMFCLANLTLEEIKPAIDRLVHLGLLDKYPENENDLYARVPLYSISKKARNLNFSDVANMLSIDNDAPESIIG